MTVANCYEHKLQSSFTDSRYHSSLVALQPRYRDKACVTALSADEKSIYVRKQQMNSPCSLAYLMIECVWHNFKFHSLGWLLLDLRNMEYEQNHSLTRAACSFAVRSCGVMFLRRSGLAGSGPGWARFLSMRLASTCLQLDCHMVLTHRRVTARACWLKIWVPVRTHLR